MAKRGSAPRKPRRTTTRGGSVSATAAQNNFGSVLDRASRDEVVFITKYARPTAVVLSIDRYNELAGLAASPLDELTQEFDDMLAHMQTAEATSGIEALFEMEPAALAKAATRGNRRDVD